MLVGNGVDGIEIRPVRYSSLHGDVVVNVAYRDYNFQNVRCAFMMHPKQRISCRKLLALNPGPNLTWMFPESAGSLEHSAQSTALLPKIRTENVAWPTDAFLVQELQSDSPSQIYAEHHVHLSYILCGHAFLGHSERLKKLTELGA